MRFSPDKYWVLNGYDVEMQSRTKGHARAELAYQDLSGYPFIKERILDYQFEGDQPIRYHDDFGPAVRCDADASAFTLSAFGLPEPYIGEGSGRTRWGVLLTVGVCLVLCALLLRKYGTKKGRLQHEIGTR